MLKITNNTGNFLEKETGELIIYGAGNAGYWTGYYMNRCGYDFSCYLDRKVEHIGVLYNGKPVYRPDILSGYKGRSLRIIISPNAYESVLVDLHFMEMKYGFSALCLVPRYMHFEWHREMYDINKFLGFFRRKLFTGKLPTIISNDCIDGEIYNLIDAPMLSPTVNIYFEPGDFIRFCNNYLYYLNCPVEDIHLEREIQSDTVGDDATPVGRLDDIRLWFAHTDCSMKGLSERWDMMRSRCDKENLLFLIRIQRDALFGGQYMSVLNEFNDIKQRHYIFFFGNLYKDKGLDEFTCLPENCFAWTHMAIENHFDVVHWLNQMCEK